MYIDNYYQCPALALDLLLENTKSGGTVRANRVGMPRKLCPRSNGLSTPRSAALCEMEGQEGRPHVDDHPSSIMKHVTTRTGERPNLTVIMTTQSTCLE